MIYKLSNESFVINDKIERMQKNLCVSSFKLSNLRLPVGPKETVEYLIC
jgi:hypothetical protein